MPRSQKDWTQEEWELYFKGIDPDLYYAQERREERNSKPGGSSPKDLPDGFSKRPSVETWIRESKGGTIVVTINRYNRDDSNIQVFVDNLLTDTPAQGNCTFNDLDNKIAELILETIKK